MAKRFKLKLSLSSFQFCRSNQTSSLPKSPLSSTLFAPINPKSLEISFPSFPDPPPTPNCPSKIMPVNFNIECNLSTCDTQKMYNSPVSVSYDSDDSTAWLITPPKGQKKKNRRKKSKRRSISSADSGWFSSDQEDHEIDEESESLMSSSENFDSSCDFGIPINNNTRKKKNSVKVRRLMRRYVSNSWKSGGGGGKEIPVRKSSVFRRMMMSCAVEGKVKESFAVVKTSENPYEDFKGSMMEMILEKQMFEAKDLEQLLQCFLSLNSRHHHAAIVQAFSEIWEDLFGDSQTSDIKDDQPKNQHIGPLEEVLAPSLLTMNLKFDSVPPDDDSFSDEEENDKENLDPLMYKLGEEYSSPKGDPVKAFVDDEAEEADDSDLFCFQENEEDEGNEDSEELNDLIVTWI